MPKINMQSSSGEPIGKVVSMMNRQRSDVQFQASKIVQACNVQACTDQLLHIPTNAVIMIDVDDTLIKPASKFFTKASYKTLIDEIKRDKAIYPHYEQMKGL